jgi:2-oxoglutarate dehydrogenase E1 component
MDQIEPSYYLRNFGYFFAKTNPLSDFNAPYFIKKKVPLKEMISHPLAPLYLNHMSLRPNLFHEEKNYELLISIYEDIASKPISDQRHLQGLYRLYETRELDRFLHQKYPSLKRFSILGCDHLISCLETFIDHLLQRHHDIQHMILAMPHRGRLHVMRQLLGMNQEIMDHLFQEKDHSSFSHYLTLGAFKDVKYHLGTKALASYKKNPDAIGVELTLMPNPSHLELVNSIAMGYTKRQQNETKKDALCVMIHGDGAVCAQGVVAETLNLYNLDNFCVGGAIHIILDNHISFTTSTKDARSTFFSSDIFSGFDIPVIYVNAMDLDSVIKAAHIAFTYRCRSQRDIAIHLMGYRAMGHSEIDDPYFTQPTLYNHIKTLEEKTFSQIQTFSKDHCDHQLTTSFPIDLLPNSTTDCKKTSKIIKKFSLSSLLQECYRLPEHFCLHPSLKPVFDRFKEIKNDSILNWSQWETLSFASIFSKSISIRLCGQDSGRGTFSQRHHVLFDQEKGEKYCPLKNIAHSFGVDFHIIDSPLSESAVLGFEYGYSLSSGLENSKIFVLWEAQFGDFSNNAQAVIDQYISSGKEKWGIKSGITLLLPHGMEGQGPEHSSARIERFLQLSAKNNWKIIQPSTGINYSFALYHQALCIQEGKENPLIIFTPKSLLRHLGASSPLSKAIHEKFCSFYIDYWKDKNPIFQVLILSGKVYFDLQKLYEKDQGKKNIIVIRVEQLYPFDNEKLKEILRPYINVPWVVVQNEMRNQGPGFYILRHLEKIAQEINYEGEIRFVSPEENASTAPGWHRLYQEQLENIYDRLWIR